MIQAMIETSAAPLLTSTLLSSIHVIALITSGIMAGLFFVFSNFAMTVLAALPHPAGMQAMQGVNEKILNKVFLSVFFLAALLPLPLAGLVLLSSTAANTTTQTLFLLAGCVLYFVGVFLVTLLKNVPMNNRLARFDTNYADYNQQAAQTYWQFYLVRWTQWNHIRTASAIAATVCYSLGFF